MRAPKFLPILLAAFALISTITLTAAAQTIPAGTVITIRTNTEISSGKAQVGDAVEGTLSKDLILDGKTIAKLGSPVLGTVTFAAYSGRLHNSGRLSLRLTKVNGIAVTSNTVGRRGKSHALSNAAKIGGGAVAGAVIGGVAGGGAGAAVGAAAGGAAGTGAAAATGKEEAIIPAETSLTFKIASQVE